MGNRILAIDYGSKTIGLAISDENNTMALPLFTIERKKESKLRQSISKLKEIILDKKVSVVVVGVPYNYDGTENERTLKTREFIELLKNKLIDFNVDIYEVDEYYTTKLALDDIFYIDKKDQKKYVDSIAATYILTDYINRKGN